jgi:hypothetical protein
LLQTGSDTIGKPGHHWDKLEALQLDGKLLFRVKLAKINFSTTNQIGRFKNQSNDLTPWYGKQSLANA